MESIFDKSEKYQKLPERETVLSCKRISTSSDIVISEESPMKCRFIVLDDSTYEDFRIDIFVTLFLISRRH